MSIWSRKDLAPRVVEALTLSEAEGRLAAWNFLLTLADMAMKIRWVEDQIELRHRFEGEKLSVAIIAEWGDAALMVRFDLRLSDSLVEVERKARLAALTMFRLQSEHAKGATSE